MKRIFIYLTFVTVLFSACGEKNQNNKTSAKEPVSEEFHTGDIVFQESKSAQSKYIKQATGSRYTHCGIIVMINGEPHVLEAVSTVTLTPFEEWKNRGVDKHVLTIRCNEADFNIDGNKYLGKRYDTEFKWDDRKMYCSELVYKVYQDNGINLGELHPVKDYNIEGMESYLKKRGISLDQLVIAPSDLIR